MKKKILVLFVFLLFAVSYSRQIQIPIHHISSPTTIELYNIQGRRILTQEFTHYTGAPFSLSNNLGNQILILRVRNGSNVITRRIFANTQFRFTEASGGNIGRAVQTANETENTQENTQPQIQPQQIRTVEIHETDSITSIIFINGMGNTRYAAQANLDYIREAYRDTLNSPSFPGRYQFLLAYNETRGYFEVDAWETLTMIFRETNPNLRTMPQELSDPLLQPWLIEIMSEDEYVEAVTDNINTISENINAGIEEAPKGFFETAAGILETLENRIVEISDWIGYIRVRALTFIANLPLMDQNIIETLNLIMEVIVSNSGEYKRVIAIGHSQGNLYLNTVIEEFNRNERMQLLDHTATLYIASPTVNYPNIDAFWYATNHTDFVINGLRVVFPGIWPGNTHKVWQQDEPREYSRHDHAFWASYFHPFLDGRRAIDYEIFKQAKILPFWEPQYHPHDVAQINRLIRENGLHWLEYDRPEWWGPGYVYWCDAEIYKRVIRLGILYGLSGDVSLDLPMIDSLDITSSQLTSLDLTKMSALKYLRVNDTELTSLDLSNNIGLTDLYVHQNRQFTSLILPNSTALTTIYAPMNQLPVLDVSNNTGLAILYVFENQLTSLDLTNNTALTDLSVSYNQLTELDVSNNTALENLYVAYNQFVTLDVSNNTALTTLGTTNNPITALRLPNSPMLRYLHANSNKLTSLNVSNNTGLALIDVRDNQLTSLDLSKNTALTNLRVSDNQLTSLNLSNNRELQSLGVQNNQLTSLDLSYNMRLLGLHLQDNQVTSLNLSNNTALGYLNVTYNQMESLILPNHRIRDLFICPGNFLPEELCP